MVRGVSRLTPAEKAMAIEAMLLLTGLRAALLVLPFRKIAVHFGQLISPGVDDALPEEACGQGHERSALLIGSIVSRVARQLFFEASCLPQALTARCMLTRRGIRSVLHFGVCKTEDHGLKAHAWLDSHRVNVVGAQTAEQFIEIGRLI